MGPRINPSFCGEQGFRIIWLLCISSQKEKSESFLLLSGWQARELLW
jgi:hypothetical protein